MKGKEIKKQNDNLYFITFEDNYNVIMYTNYTKQDRIFNQNFKINQIKDCSQYMIKNGTNCILSFNNEQYIYIVNIIDGHIKFGQYVGYYIKPLINLKSQENFETFVFKDPDYLQNNLNHILNFPTDITDFECNININKSIYNCGGNNKNSDSDLLDDKSISEKDPEGA